MSEAGNQGKNLFFFFFFFDCFFSSFPPGFHLLFDYISGENEGNITIDMTSPVSNQIFYGKPHNQVRYIVSFYAPYIYQNEVGGVFLLLLAVVFLPLTSPPSLSSPPSLALPNLRTQQFTLNICPKEWLLLVTALVMWVMKRFLIFFSFLFFIFFYFFFIFFYFFFIFFLFRKMTITILLIINRRDISWEGCNTIVWRGRLSLILFSLGLMVTMHLFNPFIDIMR